MDSDLVKYCLRHMSSKAHIHNLFDIYDISYRVSDSYDKLVKRLDERALKILSIEYITEYYRQFWAPRSDDLHLTNLKSGLLVGHSWHSAMPSMLHLSLQNKVRDHIAGLVSLEDIINMGADIMKHEYFMVCVHDLCESLIINNFKSTIPPIGSKSISDFIFNGIPYDLKITNYFNGETKESVNSNKEYIINRLLAGADVLRIREQAKKTLNNWGLNRFYILVEDQDRWLFEPEAVLSEILIEVSKLKYPIEVNISGIIIQTQLIAI